MDGLVPPLSPQSSRVLAPQKFPSSSHGSDPPTATSVLTPDQFCRPSDGCSEVAKTLKMDFCFLQDHGGCLFLNLPSSSLLKPYRTTREEKEKMHRSYIFRDIKTTTTKKFSKMYMRPRIIGKSRSRAGSTCLGWGVRGNFTEQNGGGRAPRRQQVSTSRR